MSTNQEQSTAERTNRRKQCQKCGRDLLSSTCSVDTCRFAQEIMKKVKELKELHKKSTDGEWCAETYCDSGDFYTGIMTKGGNVGSHWIYRATEDPCGDDDELTAKLHNAFPEIAKFCDQLHKDLETAREENKIMREGLGEFDDLPWVKKIFKALQSISRKADE